MMQMRYGLVLNLSVLSSMAETNFQEASRLLHPRFHCRNPASGRVYLPGYLLEPPFPAPKATWGALACIWGLYAALLLLSIPAASYSSDPFIFTTRLTRPKAGLSWILQ